MGTCLMKIEEIVPNECFARLMDTVKSDFYFELLKFPYFSLDLVKLRSIISHCKPSPGIKFMWQIVS